METFVRNILKDLFRVKTNVKRTTWMVPFFCTNSFMIEVSII